MKANDREIFSPHTTPVKGIISVEAAAGTGKTYNIVRTYLRLLLELGKDHPSDAMRRILVVTFTIAATGELRERIRSLLMEARDYLTAKISKTDTTLVNILSLYDRDHSLLVINNTLSSFDESAIHTIHGFCYTILSRFSFESGISFNPQLIEDSSQLIERHVREYWRMYIANEQNSFLNILLGKNITPDSFLRRTHYLISNDLNGVYLPVKKQTDKFTELYDTANKLHSSIRSNWKNHEAELRYFYESNKDSLNLNIFRKQTFEKHLLIMRNRFRSDFFTGDADILIKWGKTSLETNTKKGKSLRAPEVSILLENAGIAEQKLQESFYIQLLNHYNDCLEHVRSRLIVTKKEKNLLDYNDLLQLPARALRNPRTAPRLLSILQNTYDAALIDEFQDTDPLQWEIFSRIFQSRSSGLFLIGDPRQSIYRFRKADIKTYLKASHKASHRYSLEENHRSTPEMVNGVNHFFQWKWSQSEWGPYLNPEIPHVESKSYGENSDFSDRWESLELADNDFSQLSSIRIQYIDENEKFSSGEALERSTLLTSQRIRSLISCGLSGTGFVKKGDDSRNITAGDIAVLVRSHSEADRIKDSLVEHGIPAVIRTDKSVYETTEAMDILLILRAIERPRSASVIRSALITETMGFSLSRLDDETLMEECFSNFYRLSSLRTNTGIMPVIRRFFELFEINKRILSLKDGERRYTNIMHIAELLHRAKNSGIAADIRWLNQRIQNEQSDREGSEIRLESDGDAVEIVTVHASKGLEYGIVFIPFPWNFRYNPKRKAEYFIYENSNQKTGILPEHKFLLDQTVEGKSINEFLEKKIMDDAIESLSDEIRLFYVALTRAKFRCYLNWCDTGNVNDSAPGFLIHKTTPAYLSKLPALISGANQLKDINISQDLKEFSESSGGLISISSNPDITDQININREIAEVSAEFARLDRDLTFGYRSHSFSSLTNAVNIQEKDNDSGQFSIHYRNPFSDIRINTTIRDKSAGLPAGVKIGSYFHGIFENISFSAVTEEIHAVAVQQAEKWGIHEELIYQSIAIVEDTLNTPISQNDPFLLKSIHDSDRLIEAGFQTNFTGTLPDVDSCPEPESLLAICLRNLNSKSIPGYLNGFVDLIFRRNNKYWILDWKTNRLADDSHLYTSNLLKESMIHHNYILQYYLYLAVLDRHLSMSIPNYNYETHIGGVLYIFLRGMNRSGKSGVFHDRPSMDLLRWFSNHIFGDN